MFVVDFPKTSVELSNPNQENVAIYNINTISSGTYDLKKIDQLKDFHFSKYLNQVGTRLTLQHSFLKTSTENINILLTEGFYNDNYDVIATIPNRKTIVRKIKIKSISKYSPKIVL
jgi:hypothetical protein